MKVVQRKMRPKRPGVGANVQAVDADAIAADRLRPRLEWRDVLRPRRIGGRILALVGDILRLRGDETHDASARGHDHLAVSGRHDHQRMARHADRFARRRDRDRCLPVRHQHDIFVALILTREDRARLGVAVGHDEVLTARVPGAAGWSALLRFALVETPELGRRKTGRRRNGGCSRRRRLGEPRARVRHVIHRLPPSLYIRAAVRHSGRPRPRLGTLFRITEHCIVDRYKQISTVSGKLRAFRRQRDAIASALTKRLSFYTILRNNVLTNETT